MLVTDEKTESTLVMAYRVVFHQNKKNVCKANTFLYLFAIRSARSPRKRVGNTL